MYAAFSDVPYILDSLWRWAEFRAYRLGTVSLQAPHEFSVAATTPWPFFAIYVVISSFLTFGPTFTTLCTSFGWDIADRVRIAAGYSLASLALIMLIMLSSEIAARLRRRALVVNCSSLARYTTPIPPHRALSQSGSGQKASDR